MVIIYVSCFPGLQLSNVNLQQSTNATAHRTKDYDTTELVVRRGQSFSISVTFNRSVQSGDGLTITVETGKLLLASRLCIVGHSVNG